MIRSDLPRASRIVAGGAAFAAALALNCADLSAARADSAPLVGSWSGSGSISFASGSKERARCRAYYAMLRKTGARTYVGSFFNQQYNTGGAIHITVAGGSQSVRLSGEAGTASFTLRRR